MFPRTRLWCLLAMTATAVDAQSVVEDPGKVAAEALLSDQAHPGLRPALELYGQFIGVWDVAVTAYQPGEPPQQATGEWIFSWALEGRAIQDVWIVPGRAQRDTTEVAAGTYGTTLRYPMPETNTWRIVWVNPVRNQVTLMIARPDGKEIVQEIEGPDGEHSRWVFYDIGQDRFRWRAEEQGADGQWQLLQEMDVTRR